MKNATVIANANIAANIAPNTTYAYSIRNRSGEMEPRTVVVVATTEKKVTYTANGAMINANKREFVSFVKMTNAQIIPA